MIAAGTTLNFWIYGIKTPSADTKNGVVRAYFKPSYSAHIGIKEQFHK
jgi:hypothetical protein